LWLLDIPADVALPKPPPVPAEALDELFRLIVVEAAIGEEPFLRMRPGYCCCYSACCLGKWVLYGG
jgi:hypothetical protein